MMINGLDLLAFFAEQLQVLVPEDIVDRLFKFTYLNILGIKNGVVKPFLLHYDDGELSVVDNYYSRKEYDLYEIISNIDSMIEYLKNIPKGLKVKDKRYYIAYLCLIKDEIHDYFKNYKKEN